MDLFQLSFTQTSVEKCVEIPSTTGKYVNNVTLPMTYDGFYREYSLLCFNEVKVVASMYLLFLKNGNIRL